MTFFESLLNTRGLDKCPLPLWKLKITEEEFKELRELLERRTHYINSDNPFMSVCRESTIFFAEYWRRLYIDGMHSKQMVYDALQSTRKSVNFCDYFYEAACKGARLLKIEKYEGGRADHLNDMLYQGGLPMKLVTSNISNSVWDRFARGLVNRRINFEELNLGIVASHSSSMKDYCEQLIKGIETEQFLNMPYYCSNESDGWFVYLKELAKMERIRKRQLHPFAISWEFRIDSIEKRISTKYIVKGVQKFPKDFLEEQGLASVNFFSVQVTKNGQAVDTFDYANNFCRYSVISKHPYSDGDNIAVTIHKQEKSYLTGYLDFSIPHLLFKNIDGKYELGNQMGKQESLLLIPNGWNIFDNNYLKIEELFWEKTELKVVRIPAEYDKDIVVGGIDGTITFGANTYQYWTELQSRALYQPDVIEPLYDAENCKYALCCNTDDGKQIRSNGVLYKSKWQNNWTETPAFGEIYARAIDANGNYVTPIKFINIGDGLSISLQSADKDVCSIKVNWAHGRVYTQEGELKAGDVWEIRKNNCRDPRKIVFMFSPDGNSRNQFSLSIRAPFKDFSIIDIYENPIENDCWIPYSDIDKYQYFLIGQDIAEYSYGDRKRKLKWKDGKLLVKENGDYIKTIPYSGSLLTLFDSREELRSMLDRTAQNMLWAEIKVQFTLSDGKVFKFCIKESPFRPKQEEDGRIIITSNNHSKANFSGVLKLLKMDEPDIDPIEMPFDDINGYVLPETIRSWGKTLLIGRTRGRICPTMVDLTREMNRTSRANNREIAIATINENLQKSSVGDDLWKRILGWFYRIQKDDIPASSILELSCVAQNYKTLLCLVFQLYSNCKDSDELDILKDQLRTFSNDLAFQWYWLKPHISSIISHISLFITDMNNSIIQEVFMKWALKHEGEEMMSYLSSLNNPDEYAKNIVLCLTKIISQFQKWLTDLCVCSLLDTYGTEPNEIVTDLASDIVKTSNKTRCLEMVDECYIETNQDDADEDIKKFFEKYREQGKIRNENWLYKRVNIVVEHFQGKIDLFSLDDKYRRSIVFCAKSSNQHFVISLNNKLSH